MIKAIRNILIITSLLFLAACAKPHPAVGAWNITMDTPVGAMNATLNIGEDGTGSMESDELGSQPIEGIILGENSLSFSMEVDAQGQMLTLDFTGTVADEILSGEFDSDFGAFPVNGSRSEGGDAS